MTYLSLFSGCGGGDWGFHRAGLRCVGQVEIVPFRRRVLERHFPDVPRWDDIRTFDPAALGWERPDVVLFGSPCQDVSIAGRRAGLGGARSGLFFEATRIVRIVRPTFVVWENVPGALSSTAGDDFAAVIDELADCGALDIKWRGLDSRYWGVAQRRRRVWLVADFGGERAEQILPQPPCGAGNPAPSRAAGQRLAATLTRGSGTAGTPGRRAEDDVNLVAAPLAANRESGWRANGGEETFVPVARPLKSGGNDRQDNSHETYVLARALTAPASPRYDGDTETFVVPTLRTNQRNNSNGGTEAQMLVAHALTAEGHDASEDGTGRGVPLVASALSGVRRLTPVEAERLQGLPDDFTAVDGDATPDSPRYAALGDAMTATVTEWLGRRILAACAVASPASGDGA